YQLKVIIEMSIAIFSRQTLKVSGNQNLPWHQHFKHFRVAVVINTLVQMHLSRLKPSQKMDYAV
ncbi:hypothetical protein, partial [Salmonella sp. s51228]|uniref:hypothetical protein n=1 Tax=Salmonella sp. s51228 TaxID=3159652 RepID=UPI00397FE144